MNNKLRVGIYLRLSNEDADKIKKDEVSESIKNQRNMLHDYVNRHTQFVLIDEYCDEDLSGAGTYRPEFERLIDDCKNKRLDIVLCKSQSRFSRDMEIVEKYINNKFKEWNIRFIGLADNADTEILGNKKARQINGLVNEWYLEDISNNIRSAFKAKMKQGEFISPFAPFGYKIAKEDNNKLIIDTLAAETIRYIYNLYLKGMGFTGIAKQLNSKKIPSPSLYKYQQGSKLNVTSSKKREEIKWNPNAIKAILTNEIYIGHLVQGKRTTISYKNHKIRKKHKNEWIRKEKTHSAIIDENTFQRVQKIMEERRRPIKATGSVHLFSGKVFCLECKHSMRKKDSSKHEYLVCSNIYNSSNSCKNKSSIRYDELKIIVLSAINNKVRKFYNKDELEKMYYIKSEKIFNSKIKTILNEKDNLQKKVSKNHDYLNQLYEDKVNELITTEQFQLLINNYNKKENFYKKQIKFLDNEIINYKKRMKRYNITDQIFKKEIIFKDLNKIIIDEFVDKIFIGTLNKENMERDIKIIWNF